MSSSNSSWRLPYRGTEKKFCLCIYPTFTLALRKNFYPHPLALHHSFCRCGDIAQVLHGFENCFVSYGDIALLIWEPDQPSMALSSEERFAAMYANLMARIPIRFAKGHK